LFSFIYQCESYNLPIPNIGILLIMVYRIDKELKL
jgi:hypothetical protein